MADEKLSEEVRRDIGQQIAARVPLEVGLAAPGARPALGESFPVYMLTLNQVIAVGVPFARRVKDTGEWHHQIYRGEAAVRYARSKPRVAGAYHRIVQVAKASLPAALHDTITWIDEYLASAADPRLLVCPAYQLSALWVAVDARDVVVISSMADTLQNLEINHRYDADEFVGRLRENAAITGPELPEPPQLLQH